MTLKHSKIYLFKWYLLNAYYVPGTILDTGGKQQIRVILKIPALTEFLS